MKNYKDNFNEITYNDAQGLVVVVWRDNSADMTEEEFKTQQLAQKDIVLSNSATGLLIDSRLHTQTITVEMQEWINENALMPSIAGGLKRVAILLPSEIFAQVSIEQTMEHGNPEVFEVRYFDQWIEAEKWLID